MLSQAPLPAVASGLGPAIRDIGIFERQPAQQAPALTLHGLSSLVAVLWLAGMVQLRRRRRRL